jgi:hypothetical protein
MECARIAALVFVLFCRRREKKKNTKATILVALQIC